MLDAAGLPAVLPGPAPALGDAPGTTYYEIPIVIQDRSFNTDGSLFYPDTREFFDGIVRDFIPDGEFSPYWNPEFFGNMMMVNGNTWPSQTVEQRRYRFRFLNGCQSRFLILDFAQIPGVQVWQIGNEGGFLAAPVDVTAAGNTILMGLAERADVIVDFANVPPGSYVLGNVGPDEPFGGGVPGTDFEPADPASSGKVMQFTVVPAVAPDPTTPPAQLVLPAITPLPAPTAPARPLALIEMMGMGYDDNNGVIEGPVEAVLGQIVDGSAVPDLWMAPVTEDPAVGATEVWEFYNTTGDAHPMHIHEVVFEVVNREGLLLDARRGRGPARDPRRDHHPTRTVGDRVQGHGDRLPGQVTRVKMQFTNPGQFVWHCHIVEHEDNEMMRPFRIGPEQLGQPMPHGHGG